MPPCRLHSGSRRHYLSYPVTRLPSLPLQSASLQCLPMLNWIITPVTYLVVLAGRLHGNCIHQSYPMCTYTFCLSLALSTSLCLHMFMTLVLLLESTSPRAYHDSPLATLFPNKPPSTVPCFIVVQP